MGGRCMCLFLCGKKRRAEENGRMSEPVFKGFCGWASKERVVTPFKVLFVLHIFFNCDLSLVVNYLEK